MEGRPALTADPMTAPAWRAVSREHHVAASREEVWEVLATSRLTSLPETDLAVEAPWRIVRRVDLGDGAAAEVTVVVRDDGPECHLAWGGGTAVDGADEEVDRRLADLAAAGEALLAAVARSAEAGDRG